jgi:hypothetical protein
MAALPLSPPLMAIPRFPSESCGARHSERQTMVAAPPLTA